jgi:fatty-acyl-CoA synthase
VPRSFGSKALAIQELEKRSKISPATCNHRCGVKRGDRVLLDMQNGHDFVIACFAILRADAVVVPVSPMNLTEELRHYVADSDARVALTEEDLFARFAGLPLDHVVLLSRVPDKNLQAGESKSKPDDLCMMPYTSGSTGKPKGCMHTHATVLHNVAGACAWKHIDENAVALATAPFFHVTGLVHSFLSAIYAGGTMVIQRRWDPLDAARLVERYTLHALGQRADDGRGPAVAPEALKHDVSSLEVDIRRRRGDARGDRAEALRPVRRALHRGLRAHGNHLADPHQPAAEREEAVPRHPTFDTEALIVEPSTLEVLRMWTNRAKSWCAGRSC